MIIFFGSWQIDIEENCRFRGGCLARTINVIDIIPRVISKRRNTRTIEVLLLFKPSLQQRECDNVDNHFYLYSYTNWNVLYRGQISAGHRYRIPFYRSFGNVNLYAFYIFNKRYQYCIMVSLFVPFKPVPKLNYSRVTKKYSKTVLFSIISFYVSGER